MYYQFLKIGFTYQSHDYVIFLVFKYFPHSLSPPPPWSLYTHAQLTTIPKHFDDHWRCCHLLYDDLDDLFDVCCFAPTSTKRATKSALVHSFAHFSLAQQYNAFEYHRRYWRLHIAPHLIGIYICDELCVCVCVVVRPMCPRNHDSAAQLCRVDKTIYAE